MTTTPPPGYTSTVLGPVTGYDNLAPLLTTFTPRAECETDWVYDIETEGTVWKDRDYNTDYAEWCLPFSGAGTIYRPGICPSGQEFKSLDVIIESYTQGYEGLSWYVGMCCSSDFKLSYRDGFTEHPGCVASINPPFQATITDDTIAQDDMSLPPTTVIESTVLGIMEPVNIVWNENDLTYFSAPVANSFRALMGLTPLPTTTVSGSSSSPPVPMRTSNVGDNLQGVGDLDRRPSGLSDGAIAGISIGVVAFLILLVSIVYLGCVRRRQKKRDQHNSETIGNSVNGDGSPKRSSRVSWLLPWRAKRISSIEKAAGELHGQDTHEMDGRQAGVAELQDTQTGGWGSPEVSTAQWRTEIQGTTSSATQPHMPAELESQPLKSPS